jgi:GT2 family glycosyltransferase
VTALVLNWNGLDDTVRCLESLRRVDYPELSVVVVDNGSRVFDRARVIATYAEARVIENEVNLGYCGGNNVGIQAALDADADWVWILNNDVTVDAGALAAMLETAADRPETAAVGGKVFHADRPGELWMTWGRITWLQSLVGIVGQDRRDGPAYDGEREVQWLPGCSLFMRGDALRDVGYFDERFFAYHEDVDWAARARARGWQLWYTSAATVEHRVNASSGGEAVYGGFRKYLSARNSILYARRHGNALQILLMGISILLTLPFQYGKRLLTGEAAGVTMKVRGWRDALGGRPIPLELLGLREKSGETL